MKEKWRREQRKHERKKENEGKKNENGIKKKVRNNASMFLIL